MPRARALLTPLTILALSALVLSTPACGGTSGRSGGSRAASEEIASREARSAATRAQPIADPEGDRILRGWGGRGTFVLHDAVEGRWTATDPSLAMTRMVSRASQRADATSRETTGEATGEIVFSPFEQLHLLARKAMRSARSDASNADCGPTSGVVQQRTGNVSHADDARSLGASMARATSVDRHATFTSLAGSIERQGRRYDYALYLANDPDGKAVSCANLAHPLLETLLLRAGAHPPARSDSAKPVYELAITVDDLPAHGPALAGQSRLDIHLQMLAAFEKHGLKNVWGFINAKKLNAAPRDRDALVAWMSAGHLLGNHTYSHASAFKVTLPEYLRDIDDNDPSLRELSGGKPYKIFRYPFLQEGRDLAERRAIKRHLVETGYTIAQVTIDFADWAFSAPYGRCMAKKDQRAVDALKRSYMEGAVNTLEWADAAARQVMGRPTKHIVLVHVGAVTAAWMDDLLTELEKAGARFISLEDALTDKALSVETDFVGSWGASLFEQIVDTRGVTSPPIPRKPFPLLDVMCR